jgi:hypothetical protein
LLATKKLTLIVALRDIQFGEGITVHYGTDYWKKAGYGCSCGEDQYKPWDVETNKIKGGTISHGEKRRNDCEITWRNAAKEADNQQKKKVHSDKRKKSSDIDKKTRAMKTLDD